MFKKICSRMIFQVISQHRNEALYSVPLMLERMGCKVIEIRESDIIDETDGSKIDEVYVYVCKGTPMDYMRIRKRYTDEIVYEGRKTLM